MWMGAAGSGRGEGGAKSRSGRRRTKAKAKAEPDAAQHANALDEELLLSAGMVGGPSELPALADDLDPEAAWVRAKGWTPLEFLVHCYRNPWVRHSDRITAAKAVLEYVHRPKTKRLEVSGPGGGPAAVVDASALSALGDDELERLWRLLGGPRP